MMWLFCCQQAVRNQLCVFITPTNWWWGYVICPQHPSSPPARHLSSLWAERSSALILAIVPLEFGSFFFFFFFWPGLARLCHCSLLLPSLCCKWEASSKLFGDKLQSGSRWGQIWGGDGIYGTACRVGISVRLYKTGASKHTYLTSNVALEFKSGSFSTEVKLYHNSVKNEVRFCFHKESLTYPSSSQTGQQITVKEIYQWTLQYISHIIHLTLSGFWHFTLRQQEKPCITLWTGSTWLQLFLSLKLSIPDTANCAAVSAAALAHRSCVTLEGSSRRGVMLANLYNSLNDQFKRQTFSNNLFLANPRIN